jgi:hypothetical protein
VRDSKGRIGQRLDFLDALPPGSEALGQ